MLKTRVFQQPARQDNSLNAPMVADGDSGDWQDCLVDDAENQEEIIGEHEELTERKALLADALKTLNEREKKVFFERCLKDEATTLGGLSVRYHISRERIRQIELCAFEKVQKAMTALIADRRQGAINSRSVAQIAA